MENCDIEEPTRYEDLRDAYLESLQADAEGEADGEPPATWRDHLDYARDYLQDADRYCADDMRAELRKRLEILDSATEQIAQARALLVRGAR